MPLSKKQLMRSIVIMSALLISGSSLADTQKQISFPGKRPDTGLDSANLNRFFRAHPAGTEIVSARTYH